MKEYFARLSSLERRFVVGVLFVIFVLLNLVFIWPRFSDWGKTKFRLLQARNRLATYKSVIADTSKYEKMIKAMENEGVAVPPEDQSTAFMEAIQSEAAKSGVNIVNSGQQTPRTNDIFFIEHIKTLSIQSGEQELVNFLYNLGVGNSLTRVRALSLQREAAGHQLRANITLVASYQKNPRRQTAPAAAKTTQTAKKP